MPKNKCNSLSSLHVEKRICLLQCELVFSLSSSVAMKRFFLFPKETETVLTRTTRREPGGGGGGTDTKREVGCGLIVVQQGRSQTKSHEPISYQIYMKIAINYSETLETIIQSTFRLCYVIAICFCAPCEAHMLHSYAWKTNLWQKRKFVSVFPRPWYTPPPPPHTHTPLLCVLYLFHNSTTSPPLPFASFSCRCITWWLFGSCAACRLSEASGVVAWRQVVVATLVW